MLSATRSTASWTRGTRTCGSPPTAAASAPIGAAFVPSAKRSARTDRPRGIIPFIRVMDSLTLAISQGSLRRGSAAVYLDIHHPEIEEFLEIRKARRRLQPQELEPAPRAQPHRRIHDRGARRSSVRAALAEEPRAAEARQRAQALAEDPGAPPANRRALHHLLRHREQADAEPPEEARPEGSPVEPVLGNHAAHRHGSSRPRAHRRLLPLLAERRDVPGMGKGAGIPRRRVPLPRQRAARLHRARAAGNGARRSTPRMRERSVGLGLMGFHSFLQTQGVSMESAMAKVWNNRIFQPHPPRRRRGFA